MADAAIGGRHQGSGLRLGCGGQILAQIGRQAGHGAIPVDAPQGGQPVRREGFTRLAIDQATLPEVGHGRAWVAHAVEQAHRLALAAIHLPAQTRAIQGDGFIFIHHVFTLAKQGQTP